MVPSPVAPVLLLDTHSLLFRAFHALPHMNTTRGEPTSALYGTSVLLLKLLREETPRGLAFALDAPVKTFRRERYEAYKAGRVRAAPPLVQQLARFSEIIAAFGVPAFVAPGFEGDDVLCTLARELAAPGDDVLIVSGDRDLLQLVTERCSVLFVGARGQKHVRFDPARVIERFGVTPEQLPSLTALIGDGSDNLPGVPGVGARTGAKLVARFGSAAALLEHLDEVTPDRLRESLRERRAQILETADLARLRDDVPLPEGPRAGPLTPEAIARVRALFTELEFTSLLARLDALVVPHGGGVSSAGEGGVKS
jgi:DNA polymerase-1